MCVSLFLSLISLVLASQSLGFPLLLVPCFFCCLGFLIFLSVSFDSMLEYLETLYISTHSTVPIPCLCFLNPCSQFKTCLFETEKKFCFVGDLSRKYDYWDSIFYLVLNMHVWTPSTCSVPVPAIIWPIDVCPSYPSPGTEYKTSYIL